MDVLPLTVCRWKRSLDLSSLKEAQSDPYLRFISWINRDGKLSCRRLAFNDSFDGKHLLLPKSLLIQQYMWLPSKTEGRLNVVVLTEEGSVAVYSVTAQSEGHYVSTKTSALSSENLAAVFKAKLKSDDAPLDWSLAPCTLTQLGKIVLVVNGKSLAVFNYVGDTLELSHEFDCTGKGHISQQQQQHQQASHVADSVLTNNLLFVLTSTGIVLVYTLKNDTQIARVDLQSYVRLKSPEENSDLATFSSLTVLPSLDMLAVTTADHRLYIVDLSRYFEERKSNLLQQSIGALMSGRKKSKVKLVDFSTDDEEDLHILGYASGRSSSLLESADQFWQHRLARYAPAGQGEGSQPGSAPLQTAPPLHTWEDMIALHCPKLSFSKPQFSPVHKPSEDTDGKAKQPEASLADSVSSFSIPQWLDAMEHDHCLLKVLLKAQGSTVLVYCVQGPGQEGQSETRTTVLALDCACCMADMEPSVTRLLKSPILVPCFASHHFGGLAVRENSATLITCGISDQEFINKVLMYEDAHAAEGVCRLNRWEKRTLPLSALKMALELKQMDTIAFFLRPITTPDDTDQDGDERSSAFLRPSIPLLPGQLEDAMDLIVTWLGKCFTQSKSIVFAKQILKLSLEFLVNMISVSTQMQEGREGDLDEKDSMPTLSRRRLVTSETSEGSASDQHGLDSVSMESIAGYMKDLWSFISKDERAAHQPPVQTTEQVLMQATAFPAHWSAMTVREIVKDSLLLGCFPLAQSYVLLNSSCLEYIVEAEDKPLPAAPPQPRLQSLQSLEDAIDLGSSGGVQDRAVSDEDMVETIVPPRLFSFQAFLSTGVGLVLECLHKEDVDMASRMTVNMGLSVKATMKYICFHTLDQKLREFLVYELHSRNWLDDGELEAIEYLHQLERVYPVQSYHSVADWKAADKESRRFFFPLSFPGEKDSALESKFPTYASPELAYPEFFGGNYSVHSVSPAPVALADRGSLLYAQVSLQAVLHWSGIAREKVLLEAHKQQEQKQTTLPTVTATEGQDSSHSHSFTVESRQAYYIEHNNIASWKREILPLLVGSDKDPALPCSPFKIQNVKEVTELAGNYAREEVLIQLGRRNIFVDSETADFSKLLRRLAVTQTLFALQHPLSTSRRDFPSSSESERELSPEAVKEDAVVGFHRHFVQYCIGNGFSNLLYYYLDHNGLALTHDSLKTVGLSGKEHPWVDVLVQCRMAAERFNDPEAIFSASLACSRLLLGRETKPLELMIVKGRPLMALATLMYSGISLADATAPASSQEVWHVREELLKEALVAHTKLMAAIFPPPLKKGTPAETQDISLYQLLQGNTPFNIQSLFGWQSTNYLAKKAESRFRELPHFSSVELVKSYSQGERLSFLFHLRQGLPSFAFANFIVGKKVTKKNFQKKAAGVVRKVYSLAFLHLYNDRVTSACAAFLEMLGLDSSELRVDLQAARRIVEFSDSRFFDFKDGSAPSDDMKIAREKKQKETVSLFLNMNGALNSTFTQDSAQFNILKELESVTVTMLRSKDSGVIPCSQQTEGAWDLLQQFCKIHQLPPTQAYLKMCAEQGNWLSFLCHAQRYCFHPEELIPLVRAYFKDEAVADHLVLSLSANLEDKKQESSKSVHFREKYLQRMGLAKPQTTDEQLPEESDPKLQNAPKREDIDPTQVPLDLFGVIFKCRSSAYLPASMLAHAVVMREPLLAILAASEKTSQPPLLDCSCVWLLATMDTAAGQVAERILGSASPQHRSWTLGDLSVLLTVYIVGSKLPPLNLVLLFEYFDPGNPLKLLMKFYTAFTEQHDYEESAQVLRLFTESMRRNAMKGKIGDQDWIEAIASVIFRHLMVLHSTSYERSKFLKVVSGVDSKIVQKRVNFSAFGHVSELISEVGIGLDEAFIATETLLNLAAGSEGLKTGNDNKNILDSVYYADIRINSELVMQKLLERGAFEVARKCASVTEIRLTDVVLYEAHHVVKELSHRQERMNHWLKCSSKFEHYRVEPSAAVKFFENQLKSSEGLQESQDGRQEEEALLYMLVLKWLRQSPSMTQQQLRAKEREIWLFHIKSVVKETGKKGCVLITPSLLSVCSSKPPSLLTSSTGAGELAAKDVDLSKMVLHQDVPIRHPIPSSLLKAEEQEALDLILSRLLNLGMIEEARKLADLFDQGSKELSIVLTCIKLCQGQLTPDSMSPELMQGLLRAGSGPVHRRLSGQVKPAHSHSFGGRSAAHGIIQMVENLTNHSAHAKDCCRRILVCYKVSVLLSCSYAEVMEKGPLDLVMSLFACRDPIKYTLAHEFISLCHLPCEVIGDFISKRIKEALDHHFKIADAPSESLNLYPDAGMSGEVFSSTLAQLCPQHAVLGRCLLEQAKGKLDAIDTNTTNLLVAVELLIRCHDCFTMTCNTEGIADVLREAYVFFETLIRRKKYTVMVRLLIGIGRFRDMIYIIDFLVSSHHFELLLQKDLPKTDDLKTALYDYISLNRPDDTDMMMMFTLRYQMNREHAAVVEALASRKLNEIKIKKSDANTRLKWIWKEYMVAAEFYSNDDCLTAKERCVSLARLVALQLSLMPQQQIINLERQEVAAFLEKSTSFQHSLVVAGAYKYSTKIDWVDPLFRHAVLQGDTRYLADFKKVYPLSSQVLEELVTKCKRMDGKSSHATTQLLKLLESEHINTVVKRRLLCELKPDKPIAERDGFHMDISRL